MGTQILHYKNIYATSLHNYVRTLCFIHGVFFFSGIPIHSSTLCDSTAKVIKYIAKICTNIKASPLFVFVKMNKYGQRIIFLSCKGHMSIQSTLN